MTARARRHVRTSLMTPRADITVSEWKDQRLIGWQRTVDLERVAKKCGGGRPWSAAQNAAQRDNNESDLALSLGHHPIKDEWLELTTHQHEDVEHEWLHMGTCDCEVMERGA